MAASTLHDAAGPSSARAAIEAWQRATGGVLPARYEGLRADASAAGAAVLVAEGPVPTMGNGWFLPEPPPKPRSTIRRGRVAALVGRSSTEVQAVNVGGLERIVVLPLLGRDELAAIASAGPTGAGVRGAPWMKREGGPGEPTSFRIRTERATLSFLRVAGASGGGGQLPDDEHALYVLCRRDQRDGLQPARWQTATPRAEGLEIAVSDGWFQESLCRAGVVRSTAALARPLDDAGLVYGLRACESDACTEPSLLLVVPRAGSVVVSGKGASAEQGGAIFVRLPLVIGSSSSMLARVATSSLVEWNRRRVQAGLPSMLGATGSDLPASVQIGVDVFSVVGDAAPQVVVHHSRVAPVNR